ncbi:MAG: riboflavin biosynthesis protein RibF [Lachnospiraceae bacterium]
MKIISGLQEFKLDASSAIAIGKFDGVHIGHRLLLDYILKQKQNGMQAVVFTFDKAPGALFAKGDVQYMEIYTLEEKRAMFEALGIDVLIEFPLTMQTAAIPAEEFVTKILITQMQAKYIAAGEDVHFGHKGLGDSSILKRLGKEHGFEVEIVKKLCVDLSEKEKDVVASSTLVRAMITSGEIEKANKLLAMNFSLHGKVVAGNQMGSKLLDMPTANVVWPKNKIKPPFGVYFSEVRIRGASYKGITNVGTKPTVDSKNIVLAETYIYEFSDDIYGEEIDVELLYFHRKEMKFDGLEELKRQMQADMQSGKSFV